MSEPVPNPTREAADDEVARPRAGCVFFALPILLLAVVAVGYSTLFFLGFLGRPADGARTTIAFEGCAAARAVVGARVDRMGLGDPQVEATDGGFVVVATLPSDPEVAQRIPATLATPGAFSVTSDDGAELVTPADVEDASLSLKELGNPLTTVVLTESAGSRLREHMEAHPEGRVQFRLDGEVVVDRTNEGGLRTREVELRPEGGSSKEALRTAAAWGIVLADGPLPCPVTVASTRIVEAAEGATAGE